MSTRIRMDLVMIILSLLFSATLVRSDQSSVPLRSFKINEKVTYDCIDIYKQPGLVHPLLINHKIQMKPSFSAHELKNQTGSNKSYKKKIRCPNGTVPILKNTKEFNTSANKYFHPLSADSPGTHIAGVRSQTGPYRGVTAMFNAYYLNVGEDQASYSQIYIGSGLNNEVNFMQTGLMINPSVYGDGLWSFGFWKGINGQGCYNTACSGFVQVSNEVPIVEPVKFKVGEAVWLRRSIYQDKQTGNWWVTNLTPNINIGYWPRELFNLMENGANMVGAGGTVQASRFGQSPPMGDGRFPEGCCDETSTFRNIEVLNSNHERCRIDYFPVEKLLDSTKCYGLRIGTDKRHLSPRDYFFDYGGPGGNSCGI